MAVRDIGVRTVIQGLSGFVTGMERYNTSIKKAEQATEKFATRANKAAFALGALSAPLLALGFLSGRAAISFETAFTGIQKTVDATEAQFAELAAGIRVLAQEIPVSTTELAGLGETAGQLGIQVEALEDFIRVMADLGVTTNLSASQAATSLARLVNITQSGQQNFDRLGATIVDLGNNLATTEAEILNFALRIASAGQLAGVTDAQLLGLGGALSALGIRAEAGGTAVQRVLLAMVEAVALTTDELQVFADAAGVTAQEFADLFERDAGEAFNRFVEGLARAGDSAILVLRDLGLEDARLTRSFLALAGGGDLLRDSMNLATKAFAENTALVEEAERRYATAASQIQTARNQLNELFIIIGNNIVPAFLAMIDVLRPVLRFFQAMARNFPTLTKAAVLLGVILGGLAVTLAALALILPGLIALWALFTGGIALSAIAAGALAIAFSPVTLIILGIGAALIAGLIIWDRYRAGVLRVINVIRQLLQVIFPLAGLLGLIETFTGFDIPGITAFGNFAHGGTQQRTGPAVVGERGPELVTLPAGAQVTPISRSTTFNVAATYTQSQDPASIRLDLEAINMMAGA
jgi:TP901 family phage tail tape measure protein